jgi:hypothetical protein
MDIWGYSLVETKSLNEFMEKYHTLAYTLQCAEESRVELQRSNKDLMEEYDRVKNEYELYKAKQKIYSEQNAIELKQMQKNISCLAEFIDRLKTDRDFSKLDNI